MFLDNHGFNAGMKMIDFSIDFASIVEKLPIPSFIKISNL